MPQLTFNRKEMKYLIPPECYEEFLSAVEARMQKDPYGEYRTCNLYYDTDRYDLIRKSIDRPLYKEKLRMRSYGVPGPDTEVFIEIKKKVNRMVYKRRERLPYREACDFLDRGIYPDARDSQIMREIRYFLQFHRPHAALFLSYNRLPFADANGGDLRVTFDSDIRYRFEQVSLHEGDYGGLYFPQGTHLMEVKVTSAVPLWLASLMDRYQIRRTSFSKYGAIYQREFTNIQELLMPGSGQYEMLATAQDL